MRQGSTVDNLAKLSLNNPQSLYKSLKKSKL